MGKLAFGGVDTFARSEVATLRASMSDQKMEVDSMKNEMNNMKSQIQQMNNEMQQIENGSLERDGNMKKELQNDRDTMSRLAHFLLQSQVQERKRQEADEKRREDDIKREAQEMERRAHDRQMMETYKNMFHGIAMDNYRRKGNGVNGVNGVAQISTGGIMENRELPSGYYYHHSGGAMAGVGSSQGQVMNPSQPQPHDGSVGDTPQLQQPQAPIAIVRPRFELAGSIYHSLTQQQQQQQPPQTLPTQQTQQTHHAQHAQQTQQTQSTGQSKSTRPTGVVATPFASPSTSSASMKSFSRPTVTPAPTFRG
jgi:hypothetical protein